MLARARLGADRPAAGLDPPGARRRRGHHHRLRARSRPGPSTCGLPLHGLRGALQGRSGSENAIVNTLVTRRRSSSAACPSLRLQGGLFNIGAQGQFLLGAAGRGRGSACAARASPSSPSRSRSSAAMRRRVLGLHPGRPQGVSGAHEVVTTIMLNYIALVRPGVGGQRAAAGAARRRQPITLDVGNAALPMLFGRNGHSGILIALDRGPVVWFAPVPHDVRLRDPRPWARTRKRRDTRACGRGGWSSSTMTICGDARRPGGRRSTCSAEPPDDLVVRHERRLRRHRGRAARPIAPCRHHARGPAVRR